ncbi:MAG TPA: hypothetical protein VLS89_11000, partial [Candidatus Nanopelagicales bacterium]|nr:hypothetical protein [Candidatus Nanopelagicales bacterium]
MGRLVEPPALGGLTPFEPGGPGSWIARLLHLTGMADEHLTPKRAAERDEEVSAAAATYLLSRWLKALDEDQGVRWLQPLHLAAEAWTPSHAEVPRRMLRVALKAAEQSAMTIVPALGDQIRAFLDGEPDPNPDAESAAWDRASRATAALLEDAVDANLLHRHELRDRLHALAVEGPSRAVAGQFLGMIIAPPPPQRMTVSWLMRAPPELHSYLRTRGAVTTPRAEATIDIGPIPAPEPGPQVLRMLVSLPARTRDLGVAQAHELAWEELKRLRFLAAVNLHSPADEPRPGPPDAQGRFSSEDGDRLSAVDVQDDEGNPILTHEPAAPNALLRPPERFVEAPSRAIEPSFVEALPRLDASTRGLELNAHARLAKTLHWLAMADQEPLRVSQRLSHVWIAIEHLITEPGHDHGGLVARTLADVGALCRLEAWGGAVCRELLTALAWAARVRPADATIRETMAAWSDPIRSHLGNPAVAALGGSEGPERIEVSDVSGFGLLVRRLDALTALCKVIEPESALTAWRGRSFGETVRGSQQLIRWLRRTQ